MPDPANRPPARETAGSTGLAHWWSDLGFPVFGIATSLDDGQWRKRPAFRVADDATLVADDLPYLSRTGPHSGGYHQATLHGPSIRHVVPPDALVATPGDACTFVLDIDDPEAFAPWAAALGDVWTANEASTFRVATRGDGHRRHVYVRLPTGLRLTKLRIPGADAKGLYTGSGFKSGYWLLPIQRRPTGGAYEVIGGDPTDIPVADPRLIDALRRGAPVEPQAAHSAVSLRPSTYTAAERETPEDVGVGGRNDFLFREGCRLSKHVDDFPIVLEMLSMFNTRFREPHPPDEVERAARSAWERTEDQRIRRAQPEPDPPPKPTPEDEYNRYCATSPRAERSLVVCP